MKYPFFLELGRRNDRSFVPPKRSFLRSRFPFQTIFGGYGMVLRSIVSPKRPFLRSRSPFLSQKGPFRLPSQTHGRVKRMSSLDGSRDNQKQDYM